MNLFDLDCNLATGEDGISFQSNSDSETDKESVCFYNKVLFLPSKLYSTQLIVHSLQTSHYHATIVFFADTLNCYMLTFQAGNENEAAPEVWVNLKNPKHEFTEDTNTFETENISNQEKIVTVFLHFLFAWQNKFYFR